MFSPLPSLRHHCGVVGIFNAGQDYIPEQLFYGLFSLQHRGQESAGIAYRKDERLVVYRDLGSVGAVLSKYLTEKRKSSVGIGHVRYSTKGGNTIENVQPVIATCNKGQIAVSHNGNISNAPSLNDMLVGEGSIFQSTSDTELMLHLIARSRCNTFHEALIETLKKLEGAFSLAMIHDDTLIAVRDPHGFRPLYIGTKDHSTYIASETCAMDILQVENRREVKPGELIHINADGVRSEIYTAPVRRKACVFELIYFARPDSEVFGHSVHMMRKKIGSALADTARVDADVVIPVPDSGNSAALGFAERSGIRFELGLTRNHYTGRSFILPTTTERELAVRMKLHPVRPAIEGQRIILIDDSLVRGTTARNLVKLIREAGAKEVHLRLSAPELRWPCFFGIDIPTRKELISNRMSPDDIARHIGADSVAFLPLEVLRSSVGSDDGFCDACFSGDYPVHVENRLEEV
ncbi:MAG: amidophosphoribosyltransferase [Spirochaetales bacterium]|nr:amidophosphoribosyltransferase [Spirochaetales bacterium]